MPECTYTESVDQLLAELALVRGYEQIWMRRAKAAEKRNREKQEVIRLANRVLASMDEPLSRAARVTRAVEEYRSAHKALRKRALIRRVNEPMEHKGDE